MVSTETATAESAPPPAKKRGPWRWIRWIVLAVVVVFVLLLALIIGALLYFRLPSNAAGLAAQSVCSGTFVGGRDPQAVFTQDVVPQSPAFKVISTDVDQTGHSVTAKFLGLFPRQASLLPNRGCVLDVAPDPASVPYTAAKPDPKPWPQGDAAVPPAEWPTGVDKAGLQRTFEQAFVGAGDPNAGNARALAVVYKGHLLAEKEAAGFTSTSPQLGWSMTKTVNAMLFFKKATEVGLKLDTPVVDAFPAGREPPWVAQWRQDDRKNITINDLLFMRAGLDNEDDYGPVAKVVQMLYGEPSMADYAASAPLIHPPGTYWAYSTGVADIISQVAQAKFPDDPTYWAYPQSAVFSPTGLSPSATLATDTSGTWVGGSYLWANTGDWARLGQMMLEGGKAAGGKEVLPPGWLQLATTPAMPSGDGHGYGAQTWIPGDRIGGECRDTPGVPADTMSMEGHYGQLVAMVPSRDAVIVRLGWTITSANFDGCKLISDVVATLPAPTKN